MASFFAFLQSGSFQFFLVIIWIGAAYFWRQYRDQRETADYAKAGVLAFVSLLTVAAELSETVWPQRGNEGTFRPLTVDIENLTVDPTIIDVDVDLNMKQLCTVSWLGSKVCTMVPEFVIRDCAELGEIGDCIDKQSIISALRTTSYAFNRIDEMVVGNPDTIALVIDTSGSPDFDQELGGLAGTPSTGVTPISMQMEAELVGPAFTIEPEGRLRREISTLNPTRWEWEVTPEREGQHPLEVSLYVVLTKEGEKISEDKPLAERQVINVTVSRLDSLISFTQKIDPLRAFIFAFAAGLAGLLAWFGIKSWKDVAGKEPEEEKPQKIEVTIKQPTKGPAPESEDTDQGGGKA